MESLRAFASGQSVTIVCLAQVQRAFDAAEKSLPDLSDLRLPNPLDLALFNKACFMHNGVVAFQNARSLAPAP
jgi:replicative DNA helicase